MSQLREPGFDRAIALVLRVGAFAAFFVMLAGVLAAVVVDGHTATRIELAGVLIMLITPVARVLVAMILFLREKDWKYGAISAGVLLILVLGSLFGIGEH
jgi:uncharacterized membrane protein